MRDIVHSTGVTSLANRMIVVESSVGRRDHHLLGSSRASGVTLLSILGRVLLGRVSLTRTRLALIRSISGGRLALIRSIGGGTLLSGRSLVDSGGSRSLCVAHERFVVGHFGGKGEKKIPKSGVFFSIYYINKEASLKD